VRLSPAHMLASTLLHLPLRIPPFLARKLESPAFIHVSEDDRGLYHACDLRQGVLTM
jgi:hypothetical protein